MILTEEAKTFLKVCRSARIVHSIIEKAENMLFTTWLDREPLKPFPILRHMYDLAQTVCERVDFVDSDVC